MMKTRWIALIFPLVFASLPARAWNLGLETDLTQLLIRNANKSYAILEWVSPKFYFADNFHVGVELLTSIDEPSGSAVSYSGPVGRRTVPDFYRGFGFGYYFSGYKNDSFRVGGSLGRGDREFDDSALETFRVSGFGYHLEGGYQWVATSGVIGLSAAYRKVNVDDQVSMSNATHSSTMEMKNSDLFLKVSVGVIF